MIVIVILDFSFHFVFYYQMTFLTRVYQIGISFFRVFGIEVTARKIENKSEYSTILPGATYSPWMSDTVFLDFYSQIKTHTLVSVYRCYELWELVGQTKNLEGALIEVGVWRGGTGALIAKSAQLSGIKENVYLCDTFSGVVKTTSADPDYQGGEHADTDENIVKSLTKKMQLKKVKILKGIFPDDTKDQIKEKKIRFCHIDVDAFESAKDVFAWVLPKMSLNGIIVFDDYGFETTKGIATFVNSQKDRTDLVFIHNLNGHAIFIKIR